MKTRSVTLIPPCGRCGSTSATWKGPRLYCSCDQLVREKGKDRIPASFPYHSDRWPIASQRREPIRTHRVFDEELAQKLFEKHGCGNGQICDDDSCWKC
tara:strand:- start:68 stop:364 length:297 start_codon:yes stop_codon:yes gene_type:complete